MAVMTSRTELSSSITRTVLGWHQGASVPLFFWVAERAVMAGSRRRKVVPEPGGTPRLFLEYVGQGEAAHEGGDADFGGGESIGFAGGADRWKYEMDAGGDLSHVGF